MRRGVALAVAASGLLLLGASACATPSMTLVRHHSTSTAGALATPRPPEDSMQRPLVVVRARSSLPTVRLLRGTAPDERVARTFRAAGFRAVIAPVQGDTLGVGDDGLRGGHRQLALDQAEVALGGAPVPSPALAALRARLASPAWLAVCDHFSLEKGINRTDHWECSVFDVASGALHYAGAGEATSNTRLTEQQGLDRALAGLLRPAAGARR